MHISNLESKPFGVLSQKSMMITFKTGKLNSCKSPMVPDRYCGCQTPHRSAQSRYKVPMYIRAAQGSRQEETSSMNQMERRNGQTRLATRVTTLPRRVDLYFAGSFYRQAIWAVISFGVGYYCANTVSLSFGALAINDVLAAVITALFCEVVSRIYYAAPKATLKLIFLNSFKMGVVAALIADAFKLAG